jgi:hypothetical protein
MSVTVGSMATPEDLRRYFQRSVAGVLPRNEDNDVPQVSCVLPSSVGGTYVAFYTGNDRYYATRLTREVRAALRDLGAVIVASEITWNYPQVAAVWREAETVLARRFPPEIYHTIDRYAMYQQGFVVYFTTVNPTCVNRGEIYPARATVSHMKALADLNRDAAMRMAQLLHPTALF